MLLKFCVCVSLIVISFLGFSCNTQIKPKNESAIITDNSIKETKPQTIKTMNSDIEEIIKKSIDLPILQQYYHIETHPNRSPLIILEHDKITKDISIEKFGKQVLIIDIESIEKQNTAYLEFTKIEITGLDAFIEISYHIEGIACRIKFRKKEKEWSVIDSQLVEK